MGVSRARRSFGILPSPSFDEFRYLPLTGSESRSHCSHNICFVRRSAVVLEIVTCEEVSVDRFLHALCAMIVEVMGYSSLNSFCIRLFSLSIKVRYPAANPIIDILIKSIICKSSLLTGTRMA